jgi:hypothetical protein
MRAYRFVPNTRALDRSPEDRGYFSLVIPIVSWASAGQRARR